MEMTAYAAINTDETVRKASSSGGVFTLLAEDVLARGGVVFGAAVTEQMRIAHIPVENREELHLLQGSKYVRSHLGDSYKKAEEYLKAGKPVLFTGTPCQIAGLKAYLKCDYDNLLCQDLICHGAPMAEVWEKYVQYRQRQAGAKATGANFRDKTVSWEDFSLCMTFENGTVYRKTLRDDPYMKAFLKDLSLGKSCYRCAFKGMQRQADITLADFWGVKNVCPQMYDRKGTSAVFTHTEKGVEALERIKPRLQMCPVDAEAIVARNPAMIRSAAEPKNRAAFLEDLDVGNFADVVQRYYPREPVGKKLLAKMKQAVKKILGR